MRAAALTLMAGSAVARGRAELESWHAPLVRSPLVETVLRRLTAFAPLSAEEAETVRTLLGRVRSAPSGTQLVAEGTAAPPSFLVSGWAYRARTLPSGRRQIISFVLPGDALVPLLQPEGVPALCATIALTPVEVAGASRLRAALDRAPQQHDGLRRACAAAEHAEQVLLLDHIVALGRQTGCERLCALLVQLHRRLMGVGLTVGYGFPLPLEQKILANLLGMSVIHVNRCLQQLRHKRVAEMRKGWVELLRPGTQIAAF